MIFSDRQLEIIEIVKKEAPITGEDISLKLGLSRATIRPDLTILTMANVLGARPKVGYFYTGKSKMNALSEEIRAIKVKKEMSLPVVMDENTSIYDVIVSLFLDDISSVFITSNGFLIGVVSRKDLLKSAMGQLDLKNTPVGLIMTRMPNIAYVYEDDDIVKAANLIDKRGIDSIPVVKAAANNPKHLKVVGRFTKTNVTRIFVELTKGEINGEIDE